MGRDGGQWGWTEKSIPRILASSSTPDILEIPPWGPGGLVNIQIGVRRSIAQLLFCLFTRKRCSGQLPQPSLGQLQYLICKLREVESSSSGPIYSHIK